MKLLILIMVAFGFAVNGIVAAPGASKVNAPVVVQVSDIARDHDLVRVQSVQSNALLTFYFKNWPKPETESLLNDALHGKSPVRIMDGTNLLAEASIFGRAYHQKPEGGNLLGLTLGFSSVDAAQRVASTMREDLDTSMRRKLEDRKAWR